MVNIKNKISFEKLLEKYRPALKRILRYQAASFIMKDAGYIRDRLDEVCSLTVRIRDRFICFTCGKTWPSVTPGCGHLLTRSLYPTRWFESNLYCQCNGCNMIHENKPDIFRRKWEEANGGHDAYERLVTKGYKPEKPAKTFKAELFEFWQSRLREELAKICYDF